MGSNEGADKTNETEELEVEDNKEDKDKHSHSFDCSDSALPQTFGMKRSVGLDVPPEVVQAIAGSRTLRMFKRGISRTR